MMFCRKAPRIRQLLGALPRNFLFNPKGKSIILRLDLDGKLRLDLSDERGAYHIITSTYEREGKLFIGSLRMSTLDKLILYRNADYTKLRML